MLKNKDYLSWSQYTMFHGSRRSYWKSYGLDGGGFDSIHLKKGKQFAEFLAHGLLQEMVMTESDISMLSILNTPKLEMMETKLELVHEGHKFLSFIDSSQLDGSEFYEYKTGKHPWTQQKVDDHKQLLFYATMMWLESGKKVIPTSTLYWIETKDVLDDDNKITDVVYTGQIESFKREFTEAELVMFAADMVQTCVDIENFEYTSLELDIDLMTEYKELNAVYKKHGDRLEEIKSLLMFSLEAADEKFGDSDVGSATIAERKSWQYPTLVEEEIKDFKKDIASVQKKAQKMGIATQTVSKSIRIN
jgi:hypothetical protein